MYIGSHLYDIYTASARSKVQEARWCLAVQAEAGKM